MLPGLIRSSFFGHLDYPRFRKQNKTTNKYTQNAQNANIFRIFEGFLNFIHQNFIFYELLSSEEFSAHLIFFEGKFDK